MKEMSHNNRPSPVRTLYFMLRHRLPLEAETALFILESTMDVLMTWYLLGYGSSDVHICFVESNPVPLYFLDSWGLDGLVYFKFGLVALVSAVCQIIARRKVEVARRVLNFATLMVTAVVIYSIVLMLQHT